MGSTHGGRLWIVPMGSYIWGVPMGVIDAEYPWGSFMGSIHGGH